MDRPDLAREAAGQATLDRRGQTFAADEGDMARLQETPQIGQATGKQGCGDRHVHSRPTAGTDYPGAFAASGLTSLLDRLQHADDAVVAEALQVLDRPALGLRSGASTMRSINSCVSFGALWFVQGRSSAGPNCSSIWRMPASPPARW
jgi:hypothetical protein